jgi:hypothetical protein
MIRFQVDTETAEPDQQKGHQEKQAPRESVWVRVLTILLLGWARYYHKNALALMKIEGTKYYIKGVGQARRVFLGYILLNSLLFLLLSGFILMHVGLFFYLDWPVATKALLFLGLGAAYFVIALGATLWLSSQKAWMNFTGASDMVSQLTKKS